MGSNSMFTSLPDEITYSGLERTLTACKCHEDCPSKDWDREVCESIPTITEYEVRITAELRNAKGAVIADEASEPFAVTFSPDCSTDTLIFTHNDI